MTDRKKRALVVDDSRFIRTVLSRILDQAGYETVEAGHGFEALDILSTESAFDVVLLDWNMPEMNGYDLVRMLRQDPTYDAVRIVMVTTESEVAQVIRALEAGANEYVMKPFTKDALLEKLALVGL